MKKKECPSCAMEIDADAKVCPICSYEFTEGHSGSSRLLAILLIIAFLLGAFYFLFV
jgi:RNA polymerase subunit RPABC4/transcription elongation factor Spt4